ncbi:MAG: DNA polymerase III subunit alpha [Rickettsiales bacterium]|nr:DNA polymerase III subunit alpha [Rickettsiales bacterium]
MSKPFVHLRVHSPYSLLKGALRLPEMMDLCNRFNMPAVAVADHDNLFGSLEFSQYATKAGVQPIIGTSISVLPLNADPNSIKRIVPDELLLIAKNKQGYDNLLKLSSMSHTDPVGEFGPLVNYDLVTEHAEGVICLSAGIMGGIGRALASHRKEEAQQLTEKLLSSFGDCFYIELMRHGLAEEKAIEADFIELAFSKNIPLVATNNVYFANEDMYEAHDALLCISEGRYISEEDRKRLTKQHNFKSPEEMQLLFSDIPEAIENTMAIAQRCSVFSPSRDPILPSFHMEDEDGNALNETEALQKIARDGLQERLERHVYTSEMSEAEKEEIAKPYRERLEYELDVIITMKFPGYFLIVSDFITWAKEHDIPVGPGRGSGAGSVVAWSLLITDLDPLKFGLIFERFLNPERVSMPDFDIDFCQERREEVIRYVQEKYGADKVAQIITFGKLQARAVLRDVGRVLQMPYGQVDKICKLVPNNPANPVTLAQALDMEPELKGMMKEEEVVNHLVELSLKLEGLYRHASTHAAGVVIADRPLDELVPVYRDPKSDMPVVQYSMKYAEGAGLVKFDFLGLKTLSVLQTCVNLLKQRDIEIDLSTLPEGDPKTYELLARGDTVGVFQFESAGMQDALRKLKPDCFEDLIALGALYRPGPMDNIPTYIACKHGKQEPDYLHPMLEEVLRETYGVIIYQEQVQKIAQIMSGYTLGAADLLRRAMGKKIKEEMDSQREMFVKGALENDVDEKQSSGIFDLVAKFAGYGFNKSHAAAYALIAYQTAYLKANYPVEFMAASMTFDMHATDKLSIFRQEIEKFDAELLPPDINHSQVRFSVEEKEGAYHVRYALAAIKNVGEQAMHAIVREREANGAYSDVFDLMNRVDSTVMNRRQLEHLIMAGVFDSLHPNRKQLIESADYLLSINNSASRDRESNQTSLFGQEDVEVSENYQLKPCEEWPAIERLNFEFGAIGFYLSAHPLEGYAEYFKKVGVVSIAHLEHRLSSQYSSIDIAGIVTGKKVKVSPKGKFAFVQCSDATGMTEFSVFDETLLNQSAELLEAGKMVLIKADAKMEEGGPRIIAQSIKPLDDSNIQRKGGAIAMHIDDVEQLSAIKEKLGEPVDQAMQIILIMVVNGNRVHIRLPEKYDVGPTLFTELNTHPALNELKWVA